MINFLLIMKNRDLYQTPISYCHTVVMFLCDNKKSYSNLKKRKLKERFIAQYDLTLRS